MNKKEERYNKAQEYLVELFDVTPKEYHSKIVCIAGALGELKGTSEGLDIAVKELKKELGYD